ncbi:MAG TPA: HPF/RaiA family ribosome-associated protein [Gemmatimonadaceae bacterium]
MDITVQAHQVEVSSFLRTRAERMIRRLAAMLHRPVDAVVRFEQDGEERRVEIVLHAPKRRSLVGAAHHRNAGPALAEAGRRVEAQILRLKRPASSRRAREARA